jgi:hypothetical protein
MTLTLVSTVKNISNTYKEEVVCLRYPVSKKTGTEQTTEAMYILIRTKF